MDYSHLIITFAPAFYQKDRTISINIKENEVFQMIIIPVKEGENIDKALKKYKRKFEKTGVVKELRERQKYTKPSVKNREQKLKAIYIQQLKDNSM